MLRGSWEISTSPKHPAQQLASLCISIQASIIHWASACVDSIVGAETRQWMTPQHPCSQEAHILVGWDDKKKYEIKCQMEVSAGTWTRLIWWGLRSNSFFTSSYLERLARWVVWLLVPVPVTQPHFLCNHFNCSVRRNWIIRCDIFKAWSWFIWSCGAY